VRLTLPLAARLKTAFALFAAALKASIKAYAGALIARFNAPAADICRACDGSGRDNWQHRCRPCNGRGWSARVDMLVMSAQAAWLLIGGIAGALLLLATAP
jgi:hypothetical protein